VLTIDGAQGEGGGQMLRTSLTLSAITGQPFRITGIRARRAKPGLMRQHLTALEAAAAIGGADVEGMTLGSSQVTFRPGAVRAGDYTFSVGTAGSATLVLQTVLPALMLAGARSTLELVGGTHNPAAPPFEFLDRAFLPLLRRLGAAVSAHLERPGFYPAGGGRFRVEVQPGARWAPLELLERGAIRGQRARAIVSALPGGIAHRELHVLAERLGWDSTCLHAEVLTDPHGPGNVILVEIESEHVTEVFAGFGQRGVRAEQLAEGVAREVLAYLGSGVPVGIHLADQLLLPCALAGGGSLLSCEPSQHTRTQAELLRVFLGSEVRLSALASGTCRIDVSGGHG